MKQIQLSNSDKVAIVDDVDFGTVNSYSWSLMVAAHCNYAIRYAKANGKRTLILMHKAILPNISGIDHKDGNGLNNVRSNLRAATHQQNMQNRHKHNIAASSQYKGVYFNKFSNGWVAQVRLNGKKYRKHSKIELEAARLHDLLAIRLHGEFASLNFPAPTLSTITPP